MKKSNNFRKKLIKLWPLWLFISLIFVFAGVYTLIWNLDPGSFMFNEEINLNPKELIDILGYNGDIQKNPITNFQKEIKLSDIDIKLSNYLTDLINYSDDVQLDKKIMDCLKDLQLNISDKCIGKSAPERLLELIKSREQLEKEKDDISNYIADVRAKYPNGYTFGHENIRLFSISMETNKIDKEIMDIVTNYSLNYTSSYNQKNMLFINKRNEYFNKTKELLASRIARLGYWDFFYFSFNTALANSYGDLVPNAKIIRIIVGIQLFISIIFVGVGINMLSKRKNG